MKPVPRNVTPRLVDSESAEPTDIELPSRRVAGNTARPALIEPETLFNIGKHIVFAALLWPIAVALFMLVGSVGSAVYDGDLLAAASAGGMAVKFLFFAVIVAGCVATIATMVVLSLAGIILATLQISISPTIVGALAGGFIGGGAMAVLFAEQPIAWFWLVALATSMGSYGGAIGGWRSMWNKEYQWRGRYMVPAMLTVRQQPPTIRFGIRHMLIASTWLCGLMAVAKVSGLLTPQFATALGIWLAIQTVVMVVGYFVWPPYTRWRVRRCENSRA